MPTALITMAGGSRRFRMAGYQCPKYRILVGNRSMFHWAMMSLGGFAQAGYEFVFITRRADRAEHFIAAALRDLNIHRWRIHELDGESDGQATTAFIGGEAVGLGHEPFFIYNIDTYVEPRYLSISDVRGDGWVPCFPASGGNWSFARVGSDGRISELREKDPISTLGTIGLYWFRSFALFAHAYATECGSRSMENGERFVAPLYNHLIAGGHRIFCHELPPQAVHVLGTPAEMDNFIKAALDRPSARGGCVF